MLELSAKGYGFLRRPERSYLPDPQDVYVPPELIRQNELKEGLLLEGPTIIPKGAPNARLTEIRTISGKPPAAWRDVIPFQRLTSLTPTEWMRLETEGGPLSMRVLDLMTPIGKGQRALVVSPPKAGKTTVLQQIAAAISKNHPDVYLIVLLVDERPEEVTDWKRSVRGEVIASSSDQETACHVHVTELAFEIARRRVEMGEDVLILLDSLTRLGRAYNRHQRGTGRTMSGGIDAQALLIPRQCFGSARNTEEAGSLTVIASILIDTGSLMDEVIFQEFKGTGNMEVILDRKIAERRVWPAVDIPASGTRKEELLLGPLAKKIYTLRRALAGVPPGKAIEMLVQKMEKFPSNQKFLETIPEAT